MKMPANPYVYLLVDDKNQVFYVGKGRCRRAVTHLTSAMRGDKGPRMDRIRDMIDRGQPYRYIIVSEYETDDEACRAETALIQVYGSKLVNLTKGGEIGGLRAPRDRIAHQARKLWKRANKAGHGDHPLAQLALNESISPSYNMISWSPETGVVFGWHFDPSPGLPPSIKELVC